MSRKTSPAADLARMRWDKTGAEERAEVARGLNEARWGKSTEEERKAIGKRLAEARKKAKKAKSNKGTVA